MAVKYGTFEMPNKIMIDEESATSTFTRFIAEPFEKGFGHTVGNALRRILLSSLETPAIKSVRIEGIPHEYMAVDGIVEDMTNIILNLKGALLRRLIIEDATDTHDERILTTIIDIGQEDLDKHKGQVHIKLKDVIKDSRFEVVNPDLHLFTVTKPMTRQIDLRVGIGRGYVPSERHVIHDRTVNEIIIDACYSPVRQVNYYVENTRVGQDTDFDRLLVDVYTDGRVTPVEALSFAAQIGLKHFEVFNKLQTHIILFDEGEGGSDADQDEIMEKLAMRIDEMELSVRSTNCLAGASIETIAELVTIPERKMLEFRNFGKKSLNEIKAKLTEMGLYLGMDLSKYGITHDNVRQKVQEYNEERRSRREYSELSPTQAE